MIETTSGEPETVWPSLDTNESQILEIKRWMNESNFINNSAKYAFDDSNNIEDGKETQSTGGSVNNVAAVVVPITFGLIFIIGVSGNALVMAVLVRLSRRQGQGLNINNRYILSLAVADILFLFLCVPFQATVYSMDRWPFGQIMCISTEVIQKIAMLASIYSMVALSGDRYYAIAFPANAKKHRTTKFTNWILLFIWIFAAVFGLLSGRTRLHHVFKRIPMCMINFYAPKYYQVMIIAIFVVGYVAPLVLIFVFNWRLVVALEKNSRENTATCNNKKNNEMRSHVTKIVILVVVCFTINWFLHHMFALWLAFGNFPFTEVTFGFKIVSHCLSYANSCVNPLIYAFVSNRFREDFKKFYTCGFSQAIANIRNHSSRIVVNFLDRRREENGENLQRKELDFTKQISKIIKIENSHDEEQSNNTATFTLTPDINCTTSRSKAHPTYSTSVCINTNLKTETKITSTFEVNQAKQNELVNANLETHFLLNKPDGEEQELAVLTDKNQIVTDRNRQKTHKTLIRQNEIIEDDFIF